MVEYVSSQPNVCHSQPNDRNNLGHWFPSVYSRVKKVRNIWRFQGKSLFLHAMKLVTRLYRSFFVLLSTVLLAGCSGDDSSEAVGGTHEICFNADVGEVKAGTRLTSVDDATGLRETNRNIVINAYMYGSTYIANAEFSYDGASGYWKGETPFYWPVDESELEGGGTALLDFVGYWPADATDPSIGNADRYYISEFNYVPATGVFSFNCDMSSIDPNDIREFMYAISQNQTYGSNNGVVPLNFQHPFARIRFQLSDASVSDGVSINSIHVTGLKTQGRYNSSNSPKWSDQAGSMNIDIDNLSNTPFILPFTGTIGLTVKAYWIDWGESIAHTVSTDISVDWSPGTSYTYILTITPTDLKVDVDKYTEQW